MVVLDPGRKWNKKLPNGMREVWFEAPYNWALRDMVEPEAWNNRLRWIRAGFGTERSRKQLVNAVRSVLT